MISTAFRLSGALNPRGKAPAICVPAFSSRRDNDTYIQYVGIDNRVLNFEVLEESEAEVVRGSPKPQSIEPGKPALHWIIWNESIDDKVMGPIDQVRPKLLENRWLVDRMDNPFERLDFAQLSGYEQWFTEEAKACESSFIDEHDLHSWLFDTLLLSRIRYALDSAALSKSIPVNDRRRISSSLFNSLTDFSDLGITNAISRSVKDYFSIQEMKELAGILGQDVVYRYAKSRLQAIAMHATEPLRRDLPIAMWAKKLSASDAQRKATGNQRGSITLVKAGFPIDHQTYFRREFFGSSEWIKGQTRTGLPLETAVIRFNVNYFGKALGPLSFFVTFAPNRQADQKNYTTLLHLGPLSSRFERKNMEGRWLRLYRGADGGYALNLSDRSPVPKKQLKK